MHPSHFHFTIISPITKTDAPVVKTDVPIVKPQAPIIKTDAPIAKVEAPPAKVEAPIIKENKVETPPAKVEIKSQSPTIKVETPPAKVEAPVVKPTIKVETPPAKVEAPIVKPQAPPVIIQQPKLSPEALADKYNVRDFTFEGIEKVDSEEAIFIGHDSNNILSQLIVNFNNKTIKLIKK